MKKQSKILLGLAAGSVVIGGGAYLYSRNKVAADSKTGLTPLTKNSIDGRYLTCNAADTKSDAKAIKGKDGRYYRGDVKMALDPLMVKSDTKYVRNGTQIMKTDGVVYDAKPSISTMGDTKIFKNDEGAFVKSDGKPVASVYTQYDVAKVDGKLYTLYKEPISSNGPIFIVDGKEVVCTNDGHAYPISNDPYSVIPSLTPEN